MIQPPKPPIYPGPDNEDERPDGTSKDIMKAVEWAKKNPGMRFDERLSSMFAARYEYQWRRRVDAQIRDLISVISSQKDREAFTIFYAEIDDTREIPLLRQAYLAWYAVAMMCGTAALPGILMLITAIINHAEPWVGVVGAVWTMFWILCAQAIHAAARLRWKEILKRYELGIQRTDEFIKKWGFQATTIASDEIAGDGEDDNEEE